MTDTYKRRKVSETHYQCGCHWVRDTDFGDVMVECPIHKAATDASLKNFERRVAAREKNTDNGSQS